MSSNALKSGSQWKRTLAASMIVLGLAPSIRSQHPPVDFSEAYRQVQDAVVTLTVRFSPGTQEQELGKETAELVQFLKGFSDTLSEQRFQHISVVDFWETWYQRFNSLHENVVRAIASRGSDGSYRTMGVAVQNDGLVLSNNASVLSSTNVVGIEVEGANRVVYSATVCAIDPITNLALLKVDGAYFSNVVSITPTKALLPPGAPIFSVQHCYTRSQTTPVPGTMGNSGIDGYGYQLSMDRALHEEYFQAIMPVFHDSDGAPIFDQEGNLLGLLALEYRVAHYPGIVFAVPAWMIADVATDLIEHGKRDRGALGITIDRSTLTVIEAYEGQAAARAGIQPGDVIRSFNGSPVRNVVQLYVQILRTRPNQPVLVGLRRNNQDYQIVVRMDTYLLTSGR